MKKIIFFITSSLNFIIHVINDFFDDVLDFFSLKSLHGVGWFLNETSVFITMRLFDLEVNLENRFDLKRPHGNGTYPTDEEWEKMKEDSRLEECDENEKSNEKHR